MALRLFCLVALFVTAQGNQDSSCDSAHDEEQSLMQQPLVTAHMLSTNHDQADWPTRIADVLDGLNMRFPNVNLPNMSSINFGQGSDTEGNANSDSVNSGPEGATASTSGMEPSTPAAPAAPAALAASVAPVAPATASVPTPPVVQEAAASVASVAPATPAVPPAPAVQEEASNWDVFSFDDLVEQALSQEAQGLAASVDVPGISSTFGTTASVTTASETAAVVTAATEVVASGVAVPETLDLDIEEPLWEIERHVALAAMGLAGHALLGGSANATSTLNVAQHVLSGLKNSTAIAIGNASGVLLNASIAAVRNANVSNVLDTVRNSTAGVVDNVRNANVSEVLDTVRNTTAGVVDNVRNANVSDVLDTVKNTTTAVIEDVSAALENVSLGNFTSDMMNVVRENSADIFENVNLLIDAIGPFLSPALAKKHGMLMRVEDIFEATGVRGEELAKVPQAFQGDMVPESESQLELFQSVSAGERGPYVAAGRPWANGIVKYCFASDVGADVRGHFEAAVEQVVRATCLQFRDVGLQSGDSMAETEDQRCKEQPAIFVMSRPDFGCYSVVGESWMPSQQLQLQHPGCTTQGVILHEIGHALGMAHEHARPDRDQYIQVNWDNIQPEWTSAFDISPDAHVDLPYEYLSLMHYDPFAFSKPPQRLPTIQAAGGHNGDIGQRNGFAEADIDQLIVMYQEEVPGCTGREIAGTGCVDMPGDDGGDICTGLAVCGGIQNERCCACGGGIEVQCYLGETCPNPPRVPRTNHIDCVTDVTALFAAHGRATPENPCIIHNQCGMELKFKCREICTHTISAGAYQADFCHESPVTDICSLRDECEVWDPSVTAQFTDPAAEEEQEEEEKQANANQDSDVEIQRTAVEETAEVESSSFNLPPATSETVAVEAPDLAAARDVIAEAENALAEAQAAFEAAQKVEADVVAVASEEAPAEAGTMTAAPAQAHEFEPDGETRICQRPEGFCTHAGSRYVDDEDCDGDCIPDPHCSDEEQQAGFYGSASSCAGNWPTGVCVPGDPAKCAAMTVAAPVPACPQPEGFCTHPGAVFDDGEDCDGDGVLDPYCRDETEQSGFLGSANGCESTWPTGVCGAISQGDDDVPESVFARFGRWIFR